VQLQFAPEFANYPNPPELANAPTKRLGYAHDGTHRKIGLVFPWVWGRCHSGKEKWRSKRLCTDGEKNREPRGSGGAQSPPVQTSTEPTWHPLKSTVPPVSESRSPFLLDVPDWLSKSGYGGIVWVCRLM